MSRRYTRNVTQVEAYTDTDTKEQNSRAGVANPLIAGRRPEVEKEGYRLIREIAELEPELDPTEVLLEAAGWKDRQGNVRTKVRLETMSDDHLIRTVHDLRSIRDDAKGKLGTQAPKPSL